MITEMHGVYELSHDGKTVWVNGPDGCCLARFSKKGIDIHRTAMEQERGQCLDCKAGPLEASDWELFRTKMVQYYGIEIPQKFRPKVL